MLAFPKTLTPLGYFDEDEGRSQKGGEMKNKTFPLPNRELNQDIPHGKRPTTYQLILLYDVRIVCYNDLILTKSISVKVTTDVRNPSERVIFC